MLQGGGVYVESGTVTFYRCQVLGNTAGSVRAHVQIFPDRPHNRPHGRLTFGRFVCRAAVLPSAVVRQSRSNRAASLGIQLVIQCALMFNSSCRPGCLLECSHVLRLRLQGGGVDVVVQRGSTVALSSCQIYSNIYTDPEVRAHVQRALL